MLIIDIFSRRKKQAERTEPDVYQYERFPEALRVQIHHILNDAIGLHEVEAGYGSHNTRAWDFIRDALCREMGRLSLVNEHYSKDDCLRFLHTEKNVDNLLNLVEFSFRYIECILGGTPKYELPNLSVTQEPYDAIEELNFRMRESGVGYEYQGGQIVRVDSELLHAEAVRPALRLLSDPRFAGPEQEFRIAHAHYRAGEYKDCIADALNAFESTMKAICDTKGWKYNKGARASDLLKVLRANGLLPDYLDNSFDQLAATLSSGLPKVRNEEGGHGQGGQPRATPAYVATYALHLAAAKIVLLVEAMKDG